MKLLALHGHLQNGRIFKSQTGALQKHLKKHNVEFVYINAPTTLVDVIPESPKLTWINENNCLDDAYDVIQKAYTENPDVVGIFGFSQGGMLGLHLAAHAIKYDDSPFKWIKIVFAASSPFPLEDNPMINVFPCVCNIPVLFSIGASDTIASPERQKQFLEHFPNHTLYEHENGHFIPSSKSKIQTIFDFFDKYKDI